MSKVMETAVMTHLDLYATNPLQFFVTARDLGDVARLGQGGTDYVVNNPELIREIVVTKQDNFIKGRALQELKILVGEGVLTSEKQVHREDRKVMQPHYNMKQIGGYGEPMVRFTKQNMEHWQAGEVRDTTDDMMEITLDIITDTMFGLSVKEELDEIRNAMHSTLSNFALKIRSNRVGGVSEEQMKQIDLELGQAAATLDRIIYQIIENRRENPIPGAKDLLSMFLRMGMDDKKLRDQVMTIFLAGHETTANTLAWTWYELAKNPDVEQKFHAELERVLGDRLPTADDFEQLTYSFNIIQESMRMWPAAWVISREADADVQIGDYQFRPGEQVLMSQYAIHRDPRFYDNPDLFQPERWEGGELHKRLPAYAYFPFGGGPRVCLGNNFALLEALLVLCTVGQKYRLELVDGEKVVPEPLVTLRAKDLTMRVVAR